MDRVVHGNEFQDAESAISRDSTNGDLDLIAMSKIRPRVLFSIILLLITLSACKSASLDESDSQRQHVLLDNSCALPCWYGIVPGQTSYDEALLVLQGLAFVDQETIHRDTAGNLNWRVNHTNTEEISGGVIFIGGIVESINLRVFSPPLTIQQLLDLVGPPEAIEVAYIFPGDKRLIRNMVWPAQGMFAELSLVQDQRAQTRGQAVMPEDQVELVFFFAPFETLTDVYPQERLRYFQDWNGLENIALP